jgi:hypothetical protein
LCSDAVQLRISSFEEPESIPDKGCVSPVKLNEAISHANTREETFRKNCIQCLYEALAEPEELTCCMIF